MHKFLIFQLAALFSFSLLAQEDKYLNLNAFLDAKVELPDSHLHDLDIAYHQINPRYEDTPNPQKHITVEFFFSEYESNQHSHNKLSWIKELIDEDKASAESFHFEAIASGPASVAIKDSAKVKEIKKILDIKQLHYENIPEGILTIDRSNDNSEASREPSSLNNPRNFWTLIRMSSSTGAVAVSLIVMEGVSPGVAAVAGFFPGIASAGITYFSGQYGGWLTNGRWASWLIESNSYLARSLRGGMGFTVESFMQVADKTKQFLSPSYYSQITTALEEQKVLLPRQRSQNALKNIFAKIRNAEEYLKWWLTDVAFTVVSIKAPQVLLGLNEFTSVTQVMVEGAVAGTMGTLAQGPGDIAIQIRKYQKMEELAQAIKSGKVVNESLEVIHGGNRIRTTLLEEVEMVLAKNGEFADYAVNRMSHRHLQKIENWARSRATMLSFFSVAGVGMEVAGIPLARPLLITIGIGGAAYYTHVNNWINLKVPENLQSFYARLSDRLAPLDMRSLFARYCQKKFVMR